MLLSIHLAMNHAAVRAVKMKTLNRQRACLVLSAMFEDGTVLTPAQASRQERIFEQDGALRWKGGRMMGRALIGVSLQRLLGSLGRRHRATGSVTSGSIGLERLLEVFRGEKYLLWYDARDGTGMIVLQEGASASTQLKAWAHALQTARRAGARGPGLDGGDGLQEVLQGLEEVNRGWDEHLRLLTAAGWDVDAASLETTSAIRIRPSAGGQAANAES